MPHTGLVVTAAFALAAVLTQRSKTARVYSFTLCVFAVVGASLTWPELFRSWNGFPLSRLMYPLIQLIMFGMGTGLSLADFTRVARQPKPVFVCLILHYTVMPLTGLAVAKLFAFEPQIAAGLLLVGSCSSGVASNVMVYLARGDVALSVSMTTASTLVAPVMTPLVMKLLAGQFVPISFTAMMLEIFGMILIPVVGGLVFNRLLHRRMRWVDRALPVVSMAAICLIIGIITAVSRDKLLQVGPLLMLAAILHNLTGYILGYAGSRAWGLDGKLARTVAFETGLQNAAMASGLAITVLKSADAALAPAIFAPWMNISGSALASYWRGRPLHRSAATDRIPEPDSS